MVEVSHVCGTAVEFLWNLLDKLFIYIHLC